MKGDFFEPKPRGRLWLVIVVLVICAAAVVITIFGVSALLDSVAGGSGNQTETQEQTQEQPGETSGAGETSAETTPPETTAPQSALKYVDMTEKELHTGNLILVNASTPYLFPKTAKLVTVYGNKADSFKVSGSSIMLDSETLAALGKMTDAFYEQYKIGDIIVTTGYRDYDAQLALYSARVEAYGIDGAKGYVAEAGCSEHHTGLAADLAVYTDDGVMRSPSDLRQFDWIMENCHKYGFVRRFDPGKSSVTGILGEEWHFRYVGVPHAYYMKKHDLCLEEYITLLRGFPYDGEHLTFSDDLGGSYEIYFVPLLNGDVTKVPVPENSVCTISGNNSDGFVVTVKTS